MPVLVGYVAEFVASVLIGAGVDFGAAAVVGTVVGAVLVYGTEAFLMAKISAALQPSKGSSSANTRGMEVALADTGADGYAIYGAVRVGGVNVIDPVTGGDKGRYLEQIIAHTIHEITGYGPTQIDAQVLSPDTDINGITGASTDGQVTTGSMSGKAWVRGYKGTASQAVDFILSNRYPTVFTSAFRGRGYAYTALTFDYADGKTWNGLPQTVREVWGRKCYDPRKDSTNGGSGTHRLNDATTWEWTQNCTLCWADHAMASFGGRVSSSNINWPAAAAAANICDGLVPIPLPFAAFATDGNASSSAGSFSQYQLIKISGASGWDASVRSTDSTTGGAEISGSASATTVDLMFGFSTAPAGTASYTGIDYAINFNADGNVHIYEGGVSKGAFGSYFTSTVCKVYYDGTYVWYTIDDRCVRVVGVPTLNQTMYLDTSLFKTGDTLYLGVQKRYTFNGRFQVSSTDWRNNSKLFVDAMLGRIVKRGPVYYIYAGAWTAASFAVGRSDWAAIQSIKTSQSRDGGAKWNSVHVWYLDPKRNWQREECNPRTNPTYQTADGSEQIALQMEQPACRDEFEAQRKGEFMNRRSRNQIAMVGVLPPRFRFVCAGDVGSFTFPEIGWQSKSMRIVSANLLPDSSIQVSIAEEQSGDWTDLLPSEYNQPSAAPIPTTNPTAPSEPQSFAVTPGPGQLVATWVDPLVKPLGTRFQVIRSTNSGDASVGTVTWDGVGNQALMNWSEVTSPYWYYGRAYANSYYSPYTPNTFGLLVIPNVPPAPAAGRGLYTDGDFSTAIDSYWNYAHISSTTLFQTGGFANRGRFAVTGSSNYGQFLQPINIWPNSVYRQEHAPIYPSQSIVVYTAYRRRSTLSTSGGFFIKAWVEDWTTFVSMASQSQQINKFIRCDLLTVDVWTFDRTTFTVPNSQYNRMKMELDLTNAELASGIIEIGQFQAFAF